MSSLPENVARLAELEAEQAWPDRLPLFRDLPPAEPYPVETLGPLLGPACGAITATIRPPAATAAASLLATAALAAQAHANVLLDGRVMPLSLYLLSILESGGRKTATDNAAQRAVHDVEHELATKARDAAHRYDAARTLWEQRRKEILGKKPGSGRADTREDALRELGPPPDAPMSPQLTTADITIEGLTKHVAGGRPSVGVFSSEGGQFVGGYGWSQEMRLRTAAGFSGLWDGGRLTRTRGGDGSAVYFGRRVALHLMMQPAVAPLLLADRLVTNQGFTARCLVAQPKSTLGSQTYVECDLTGDPRMAPYYARVREFLTFPLPLAGEEGGDPLELRPRPLALEPAAKAEWIAFHDHIQKHLGREGAFHPVAPFAAKAAEHALRLAGVLTLVGDPGAVRIDRATLEAGVALADWYLREAVRLRDVSDTRADLVDAARLLAWLQARGPLVPVADVYQLGPRCSRDKASATKLLTILAEHGHARPVEGGAEIDGQHRRSVWEVRE